MGRMQWVHHPGVRRTAVEDLRSWLEHMREPTGQQVERADSLGLGDDEAGDLAGGDVDPAVPCPG